MVSFKSAFISFIFIISLGLGAQAKAKTVSLAILLRSDSSEVTKLSLRVNHRGIIKRLKIKNEKGTKYLRPKDLKGEGTAVLKKLGVKIIVLKSHNFDEKLGGIITLDYLRKYRFLRKDLRGTKEIELVQNNEGKWQLLHDSKPFSKIKFEIEGKGIKKVIFK